MYDVLDETPAAPPAAAATRVDDQDPLRVRRRALLVEQAGLGADRGHRAHGVEEVGEQQREDQQQRGQRPRRRCRRRRTG